MNLIITQKVSIKNPNIPKPIYRKGITSVCASLEDSRMKLSYDLYYLRNANPPLDFLILLKTIKLVSLAKGSIPAAVAKVQLLQR